MGCRMRKERRREARNGSDLQTELLLEGSSIPVILFNLSSRGLHAVMESPSGRILPAADDLPVGVKNEL
jgi:hypothetical protein